VLTGLVTGSKALISLRVLLGIVEAPTYPSGTKLQSIWLTTRERGRGATLLDSGSSLGTALGGPIVVAFMAWLGGWRGALIGAGILTILIAWLSRYFIKGTPNTNPRVNTAEREYLQRALDEEYETDKKQTTGKVGAKAYLKHRNFWCMCIGFYSLNTVFYGLMTWGPSFLAKTQNLNIQSIGGSIFMIFGAGVAGELFGGWLSDKWRSNGGKFNTVMHTLLGIAGIMSFVSILLLGFTSSLAIAITLLCSALFSLRFAGLYWSLPTAIAQREHVGTLAGCMNFSGNIAGIVTPIVVGLIVSITGSYFMSLMMFALFGLLLAGASFSLNFNKKIGSVKGV
jgi:ACS family D-galactonate transporter-like MFS transporter